MDSVSRGGAVHLLTGVTGFVGKLVLRELLRRDAGPERVLVIVRSAGPRSAAERFEHEVAGSPCLADLSPGWRARVAVLEGDLERPGCGLAATDRAALADVTHVVHGAASVDFDLPLAEATRANVTTALETLALARACPKLAHFVLVSTAYVTPHRGEGVPLHEAPAPLPEPAETLLARIQRGEADEADLLARSGHPNTYTFTKALAEALVEARRGPVPVSVVRPSVISASWREPFPGWIDSPAAFAGFVALIGTGHLRAVVGDADARVDVVPVDQVARRVVEVAATPPDAGQRPIHHVTAGFDRALSIRLCRREIVRFFRDHPAGRRATVRYVGPRGAAFRLADHLHHRLPVKLASLRSAETRAAGARLLARIGQLNAIFPYFTTQSFDFRSARPFEDPGFEPEAYVKVVCAGVWRHLLRRDERELLVAGRAHPGHGGDLRWAASQHPGTPFPLRVAAWLVTKSLRRIADEVTIDRSSFDAARERIDPRSVQVLAPSHRSYLDFVLCSYLCFARPELGFAVPRVAAASEFARLPLLGRLLGRLGAFYLERGRGKEDKALTRQVDQLVRERQVLEFFVEGGRSRSRVFLPPKRGLLRSLQATGTPATIIPVAFSYDRVPEERSFARELAGGARPPMRVLGLLGWSARMLARRVRIGRVHVACAEPLRLDLASDVHALSHELMGSLQRETVVTRFHLRAFAAATADPELDERALRRALERRGARVLQSPLRDVDGMDGRSIACVRHHFEHWFHAEADAALPDHPAVQTHLDQHDHDGWREQPRAIDAEESPELRDRLLRALFEPVCRDWVRVTEALGTPEAGPPCVGSAAAVAALHEDAHLPSLEAAWEWLVSHGVLEQAAGSGKVAWGSRAERLEAFAGRFAWPEA